MKASGEFNALEVWVECEGKRLNEFDPKFHIKGPRQPPTYSAYLEIGSPSCSRYTFHVKNNKPEQWLGNLMSDVEIDDYLLCTAFLHPQEGHEIFHGQVYKSNDKKNKKGMTQLEDVKSQLVQHEDTDGIILLNSPVSSLGQITISIWRGIIQKRRRAYHGESNVDGAGEREQNMYNGQESANTAEQMGDFEVFQDDDVDPWVRFVYTYGTHEALVLNDIIPPHIPTPCPSPLVLPDFEKSEILVPDSTPPSPRLIEEVDSNQPVQQSLITSSTNIGIPHTDLGVSIDQAETKKKSDTREGGPNPVENNLTEDQSNQVNHNQVQSTMALSRKLENIVLNQEASTPIIKNSNPPLGSHKKQEIQPQSQKIPSQVNLIESHEKQLLTHEGLSKTIAEAQNQPNCENLNSLNVPRSQSSEQRPHLLEFMGPIDDPNFLQSVEASLSSQMMELTEENVFQAITDILNIKPDQIWDNLPEASQVDQSISKEKILPVPNGTIDGLQVPLNDLQSLSDISSNNPKPLPEVTSKDYAYETLSSQLTTEGDVNSINYLSELGMDEACLQAIFGVPMDPVKSHPNQNQAGPSGSIPKSSDKATKKKKNRARWETISSWEAKQMEKDRKKLMESAQIEKEQKRLNESKEIHTKLREESRKRKLEEKDHKRRNVEKSKWLNNPNSIENYFPPSGKHDRSNRQYRHYTNRPTSTSTKKRTRQEEEESIDRIIEEKKRKFRESERKLKEREDSGGSLRNITNREGRLDRKGRIITNSQVDQSISKSKDRVIDLTLSD